MKITQDVQEYAAKHGMESTYALEAGACSRRPPKFCERGGEVFLRSDSTADVEAKEPVAAD
jgi:hypothetical protein